MCRPALTPFGIGAAEVWVSLSPALLVSSDVTDPLEPNEPLEEDDEEDDEDDDEDELELEEDELDGVTGLQPLFQIAIPAAFQFSE